MILRLISVLSVNLLATPLAATCTAIGPHGATDLKYICDSERSWAQSVATGDASTVKHILADDFIGVDPKGNR